MEGKYVLKRAELCVPCMPASFVSGQGVVAQSVERATPGEEVPGLIPAMAAHSLLVGSMSV